MLWHQQRNHLLRQIWTSSGVLISIAGQGMMLGYMPVLLPALREPSSGIQADLHDESWIASSSSMSVILGFLLASVLMEVFGRKLAYIMLLLPGPIGLILIYTASSVPVIVTGRMLAGVTSGGTILLGAVVIGEYTSPKNRGMFLNLKTAAASLGTMASHILSFYYHWRTIALIILIPYVISLIVVTTWLESPAWLILKDNVVMSERNFYFLRGMNHESQVEFEEMIRVHTKRLSKAKKSICVETLRQFKKRSFMRPIFIMFMGFVLLEMSGGHIFPTYASDIISKMEGNSNSFSYTLCIDIVITLCAIFSSFLIKFMNTRTLLFSTGAASLLVLLTANTYLFLSSNNMISDNQPWIPTTMFSIYFILVNLGCSPVPMALLGEIFPLAHKGLGLFVTGVLSCLCTAATIQAFPYLLSSVKIYGTFAITGMIQTLMLMFLFIVLPETKNKTLQEIEDNIQYGRLAECKSLSEFDERDKILK